MASRLSSSPTVHSCPKVKIIMIDISIVARPVLNNSHHVA